MIVTMKRLTLVALKSDEESLLEALQNIGTVEVLRISESDAQDPRLEAVQDRLQRLNESMEAVKQYADKPGLLSPQRREETLPDLRADASRASAVSDAIESLLHREAQLSSEQDKAAATRLALLPWTALTTPMQNVKSTRRITYFVGMCAAKDVSEIQAQDYIESQFFSEGAQQAVILACQKADEKAAQGFLKTIDWTDVAFPKVEGTPAEVVAALDFRDVEIEKERKQVAADLEAHGKEMQLLENAMDAETIDCDRLEAHDDLLHTRSAFALEGWIREDEIHKTEDAIHGVTDAYFFETRAPEEGEIPPSVVKNNKVAKPFEEVQTLYARPLYGTIDGTPLMTPFYILLFGLMLSDSGYGILLALGAFLYVKFKKPTGMSGGISRVLVWGGISTIVWGLFVGSFFGITKTPAGNVFDGVSLFFQKLNIFPIWLDPMANSMEMLALCLGLGVVHLITGYLIKAIDCFRRGDWASAIFDHISWVMIILGLIIGFLPQLGGMVGMSVSLPRNVTLPATIVAGVGAFLILVFKGRNKPKFFGKVTGGLGELYNITGVISDILSYARLFALGIATGVIGQVFNTLCGMLTGASNPFLKVLGIIGAIVLLIVLHTFNVAINTLGAFVHCARLQYVEFYGKFYEAGGREFRPLSYKTKHTLITNKNNTEVS